MSFCLIISCTDCGISSESAIKVEAQNVNSAIAYHRFPWTVLIVKDTDGIMMSFGTGALVTPLHVLTATHLLVA